MEEPEIIVRRVRSWTSFPAPAKRRECRKRCRTVSNKAVRLTPVGPCCLDCWLSWPTCPECGWAPATIFFQGRFICWECLNPAPTVQDVEEAKLQALIPETSMFSVMMEKMAFKVSGEG